MKKRFQNILSKTQKHNGRILITITLLLVLTLGTLAGCSDTETDGNDTQINTQTNAQTDIDTDTNTIIENTNEPTVNSDENNSETTEIDTSYLAEAMMEQRPLIMDAIIKLNEFVIAYFMGDTDALKPYLTNSYSYNIETYHYGETFTEVSELTFDAVNCHIAGETEEIPKFAFLGISEANIETDYENLLIDGINIPVPNYTIEDGYTLVFSIPLMAMPFREIDLDYREYLTVEMVRQGEDWKIQFYGLEL